MVTETGKPHLAVAPAMIRNGTRGRFSNVVDLVNRLETGARNRKQDRLADYMPRLDFVILDELGALPLGQSRGQLLYVASYKTFPNAARRSSLSKPTVAKDGI